MAEAGSRVGMRLGVYELQALIGAGGMGEVYRARDTRLQRDVAIKLLPQSLTADSDRLARFEREARLLAALNHPNVAAIYGIEDAAEGQPALILELIDGQTLAERIAMGPIPVAEAIGIARQIVDALDAAHRKDIIHRDLKPANIKLAPNGTVKVLDFGLAKALQSDRDATVTVLLDATRAGTVLGTVPYMSPEQARGLQVDRRTDVWSFGCVVFEMLSGRRAFAGPTTPDTLAAILERPPQWASLPVGVPQRTRGLLERCLEKDPLQRLGDISDAKRDLEGLSDATSRPTPRRPAMRVVIAVAAMIAVVGLAIVFQPEPAQERTELTLPEISNAQVAFSPDGKSLAIAPKFDSFTTPLVIRQIDSSELRTLKGTEGAIFPFWSPDGRSIGFFAGRRLKRIDLAGEAVQDVADAPIGRGGAWTRDGNILFAPSTTSPIYRVAATGGPPVAITRIENGQTDHRAPELLPDGRHFLFYARGVPQGRGVYVANIDGSNPTRLLDAAAAAVYAPNGHLIFPRDGRLLAQRFDEVALALAGTPHVVSENASINQGVSLATLSASVNGALAFATASIVRTQLTWFDRTGKTVGTIGEPDPAPMTSPALSPDGTTLALGRLEGGNWDIWSMDMTRGLTTRITDRPSLDMVPVWMHNSRAVIYQSNRSEVANLYRRSIADGRDDPVLESTMSKTPSDVSADGRFLLFSVISPAASSDIWVMPLDRSTPPRALVESPFNEGGGQFSPNGRWMAYTSNATGRFEVYATPFPGPGPRLRISPDGGNLARWSHSGRELFYLAADGRMMSVPVREAGPDKLEIGAVTALFLAPLDPARFSTRSPFVVSLDDQRLLIPVAAEAPKPGVIVLLQHWRPPS